MINPEVKYPIGSWWHIPDSELYVPFYSPWFGRGVQHYYDFAAARSIVSVDRDVWECGVYKGGTAAMMAAVLEGKRPSRKWIKRRGFLRNVCVALGNVGTGEDLAALERPAVHPSR